jgi:hypothetical protein
VLHAASLVLLACGLPAAAQPDTPVLNSTWSDCDTSDNKFVGGDGVFHWDVDPDCDIYQQDVYERPVTQTFYATQDRYGAREYFEYLDIIQAGAGFDSEFLYVQIDLAGRNHLTSGGSVIEVGMAERYGFRFSTDPDGRNGVLIVSDQPEFKNEPNTVFGPIGTFGYRDTDGDVGGADFDGPTGLTVTKSDNPDEEGGTLNGYDAAIISDGRLDDETPVLWVRLHPSDSTIVEFALDYKALGFTEEDLAGLAYLHFEAIKGGAKDPQNYLWNDKYAKNESGSPYPGANGLSEFGTDGLKNVYETDTVVGGAIAAEPPPEEDGETNGGDTPMVDSFFGSVFCGDGVAAMLPFFVLGFTGLTLRQRRRSSRC